MKIFGYVMLAILVIGGLSVLSFAGSWFHTGAQIVSPENVTKQWQFSYDYYESLQSIARQACQVRNAEKQATPGSDEAIQRHSQELAIENNYARVEAEYNARLRNAFEAGWVRPRDVPQRAPEFSEMTQQVCG